MKRLFLVAVIGLALTGCGKKDGLGNGTYMLYCQKMVKSNVKYPATVDFYNTKAKVVKRSGEVTVVIPFTAKNAFGVPISNIANCTMDKDGSNQSIFIH